MGQQIPFKKKTCLVDVNLRRDKIREIKKGDYEEKN